MFQVFISSTDMWYFGGSYFKDPQEWHYFIYSFEIYAQPVITLNIDTKQKERSRQGLDE